MKMKNIKQDIQRVLGSMTHDMAEQVEYLMDGKSRVSMPVYLMFGKHVYFPNSYRADAGVNMEWHRTLYNMQQSVYKSVLG